MNYGLSGVDNSLVNNSSLQLQNLHVFKEDPCDSIYEKQFVRDTSDQKVYLILDCKRRYIKDWDKFKKKFLGKIKPAIIPYNVTYKELKRESVIEKKGNHLNLDKVKWDKKKNGLVNGNGKLIFIE